jgi:DNA-binding XRE family transcriptional regulator
MTRKTKRSGFDRYVDEVFREDGDIRLTYLSELAREPIGTQLAVLRHRLGLTQEEVARRMHVSQSNVARLERKDENPTAKMIARAAKALGCRVLLVPEKDLGRFSSATA